MTLLTLVACGFAVAALGCAFAFMGVAAVARLSPEARASDALLDACLIATALALLAITALGFAHMLSVRALGLVCAVGCGVAWRAAGSAALRALRVQLLAARAALRESPLAYVWVALGVLLACRGLAQVPVAWDSLTYHLAYPAHWIREHGFSPFEGGGMWEQYESFPKAGEALFWLAMAPFRSDAIVNLVNLPFWFGIALAFRCAARQLGASARAADAWVTPLLLHPTLSAYVTPAYVELQTAFYMLAAVALALRARTDLRALPLLLLAVCLALATKITALAWLLPLALYALVLVRVHGARPVLRALRAAPCLLGLAVALPWYVDNVVRCDNPVYPAALPFAASGPAAGSLALSRTLTSSSIARIGNYDELLALLVEPPWQVKYPLGPGAMLPAIGLALLLMMPFVRDVRLWRRVLGLCSAAAFLCLIYLLSPHNGEFMAANTRFLAAPCLLVALALATVHDAAPRVARRLAWTATTAIAGLALLPTRLWRLTKWAPPEQHPAIWIVALLMIALCVLALRAELSRRNAAWSAVLLIAAAFAGCSALQERERDRAADLISAIDLHPVVNDARLYDDVLRLGPARIAFAVGGVNADEGWFFYPLFGARLEHSVEYVDIERTATAACRRRGRVRDQPDEQAWLKRLAARGITHLFLSGLPLESRWAHAHSERFALLAGDETTELFRVTSAP
jgi:hypothetical protein